MMKTTREQEHIIQVRGDAKINAVAGSGKTTTLIELAKTRPKSHRILYLAFNKSVKTEALVKFAKAGLNQVKIETAHSMAYRAVVPKNNYEVSNQGYKHSELVEVLGLSSSGKNFTEYILADHVLRYSALFCNKTTSSIAELDYLSTISDPKAKAFAKNHFGAIQKLTRVFMAKMNEGSIPITHDFYLKKFQLSKPVLPYDMILFDEGQDASPVMLNIFLNQDAEKIIVGDSHQQIYSWRFAENALETTKFPSYSLSQSFRFSDEIADLANKVLALKSQLGRKLDLSIKGLKDPPLKEGQKAIIARTNLGLLKRAIELVYEGKEVEKIYFEGNFNSYTYADSGTSLYDVLSLYQGRKNKIRDKLIKRMPDMQGLEEYIKKTGDIQLSMMAEIVRKYKSKIPKILKTIKDSHLKDSDKPKAEIIFSTVHRAKGMEYEEVELIPDFLTEENLNSILEEGELNPLDRNKLNEEINLLYVAITRTRGKLKLHESLVPEGFKANKYVEVILDEESKDADFFELEENGYSEIRKKHKLAYRPWTPEQDEELTILFCEGARVKEIAEHFGRTHGAIRSRIKKLELLELYGS